MKEETEFQAGEECFYHEGLNIIKCKILSRLPGYYLLNLTLDPLEIIQQDSITNSIRVGSSFTVSKNINDYHSLGAWFIDEVANDETPLI